MHQKNKKQAIVQVKKGAKYKMIKYDLRKQGFAMREKTPGKYLVTMFWVILTMVIFGGGFALLIDVVGQDFANGFDPLGILYENLGYGVGFMLVLAVGLLLYIELKFILTVLFCHSVAPSSIKLKILEGTAMPVCFCREALKVWQTLLIYLLPVVFMYSLIFWLCVISGAGALYIVMLFFMSFYMAYDLTLVLYIMCFKLIDRMEYISIDHHVYAMTLYRKSYVKLGKKQQKSIERSGSVLTR